LRLFLLQPTSRKKAKRKKVVLIQKDGFNKRRSEGGGDKNAIFMGKEKKALTLHHQQYGDVQEGDPETDRRGRAP